MAVPIEHLIDEREQSAGEGARPTHHTVQNEKAARQLGSLFFQGRIVLTEIKPSKLSGEIL
jgi:hypothetical protein